MVPSSENWQGGPIQMQEEPENPFFTTAPHRKGGAGPPRTADHPHRSRTEFLRFLIIKDEDTLMTCLEFFPKAFADHTFLKSCCFSNAHPVPLDEHSAWLWPSRPLQVWLPHCLALH